MYACPWCSNQTFSFWDKQSLGPRKTAECRACKRPATVAWERAQIAVLPMLLLGFLGLLFGKAVFATWAAIALFGWVGISLGMLFTAPIYHFYVPLVKPA